MDRGKRGGVPTARYRGASAHACTLDRTRAWCYIPLHSPDPGACTLLTIFPVRARTCGHVKGGVCARACL